MLEGLRLMTQLTSNRYKTAEWPKDFTEVITIALERPKATKFSYQRTIRLIAHRTKAVRITKNNDVLAVSYLLTANC